MIKKTLFSLLTIVSFVSTQALGHVFPIYQDGADVFVALRSTNLGLSAHNVDVSSADTFNEEVRSAYELTLSGIRADQTEEEFEFVMSILDRSLLVGFVVLDESGSTRYLTDEAFVAETQDTKPYFDSRDPDNVGVYFQTLEGKRIKLTADLNALLVAQEQAQEPVKSEEL